MEEQKGKNKENVNSETEENHITEIEIENIQNEVISGDSDKSSNSESKVVKFMKSIFPTVIIAIGSFLLIVLLPASPLCQKTHCIRKMMKHSGISPDQVCKND